MAPKLLNILLQRSNSNVDWGFKLSGGKDLAKPLAIVQVLPGTLASQYFVPGDIVLGIQGYNAADLLHMEAIDLVRQPAKSLELLVQKIEHIHPASIWGPGPVLKRPSEWLRQSPSPDSDACSKFMVGNRPASVTQALDSRLKQQFQSLNSYGLETPRKASDTRYQVSPVASDVNQARQCCDVQAHWRSLKLRTPQERYNIICDTPQHGHLVQLRNDPDSCNRKLAEQRPSCRVGPVTEKPRISATADILKRPISPEFTAFPNSKSNSLLKLVLSKSLLNYSPQDFEEMRAASAESYSDEGDSEISESDWTDENDDDSELRTASSSRGSGSGVSLPDSPSPSDDCMGRQSSHLSAGGSTPSPGPPSAGTSGNGATDSSNSAPPFPAPPPPPPPAPGPLPTVRLSTEIPDTRGYEPPAAIQNAMMTKDKKPFTYTPGGLDLSQIRSPRMQRRITRNANSEGVADQPQPAGPKTSPLAQTSPQGPLAAMQPQVAVPVLPTGGVQLQSTPTAPPPPPPGPATVEPPPNPVIRPVQSPKASPVSPPVQVQNEPGSIYVPPVTSRSQVGSLYIPPISSTSPQDAVVTSQRQQTPTLNKAPTPWMSQHQRQQQKQQPSAPAWVNREEPQHPAGTTHIIPIQVEGRNEPVQPQPQPQQGAVSQPHTRIVPIQIEGSTAVINSTSNPAKQQTSAQQNKKPVYVHNKFNPQTPVPPSPVPHNHSDNQSEQNSRQYQHQQSWGPSGGNGGPTQSRSFRVLQKITDTDSSGGEADAPLQEYGPPNSGGGQYNSQQLRKLQLSDDDRALMNKFKAQVDEDSFLHTESDPRYRGAAIPSRAFRMLQNMTDGSADYSEQVPRGPAVARDPQARPLSIHQTPSGDGTPQPYIPPSEQQVPEPRKYTGGAIPSRSFRMLQAMTAPENCGPGQSDM